MKVATNRTTEATQAISAQAMGTQASLMAGAIGTGNTAFATLLDSFTANAKPEPQQTVKAAEPKAAAKPAVQKNAAAKHCHHDTAAENAQQSAATPAQAAHNEDNEQDGDNEAAETAATDATAAPAAQTQNGTEAGTTVVPQTISMQEIIKNLNLNEQQVAQLAQTLNVSVEELKQMQISLKADAQTGLPQLTAISADGKQTDLAKLLNIDPAAQNAAQQVADKIASALKLDETQKKDLFAQLNIDTISANNSAAVNTQAPKSADAAKQTAELRPADNGNNQSVTEMGAIAANETAQGQGQQQQTENGNSFNSQAGIAMAVAQEAGAQAEGGKETDFNAALKQAGETGAVSGAKAAKTEAAARTQTQAVETPRHAEKVMRQIVEKASILQLPHATTTKISLNPKELGSVDIKLVMHDASVKASITVENTAVKQAVEQNLDQLKSALREQGISVDEMQVNIDQRNAGNGKGSGEAQWEAAQSAPWTAEAPRAAAPAPAPAFMRRPAGDSRVNLTV